ncbi:hypothetical protein ACWDR5_26820 [Streptomyces koyangensis]
MKKTIRALATVGTALALLGADDLVAGDSPSVQRTREVESDGP